MSKLDPNVKAVIGKFKARAKKGLAKYGVDTTRTDLSTQEWLQHAQDEALDLAIYLQRLLSDHRRKPAKKGSGCLYTGRSLLP